MLDSWFGWFNDIPLERQVDSKGAHGLHSRVLRFTPRNNPSVHSSMEDRTMIIDPECIAPHISPITSYLRDRAAETVITVPEATNAVITQAALAVVYRALNELVREPHSLEAFDALFGVAHYLHRTGKSDVR